MKMLDDKDLRKTYESYVLKIAQSLNVWKHHATTEIRTIVILFKIKRKRQSHNSKHEINLCNVLGRRFYIYLQISCIELFSNYQQHS